MRRAKGTGKDRDGSGRAAAAKAVAASISSVQLPGVTLSKEVGAGNYGTVWTGNHDMLSQPRAVKILHTFISPEFAIAEAKKQMDVQSNNVVKVFDLTWAQVDGEERPAIVMEYCSGTLAGFFKKHRLKSKGVPYSKARPVLAQILEGMNAAHRFMIHGDLKPANILMIDDVPKIADFGAARHLYEAHAYVRGSSNWMAPEVTARTSDVTKESDYFSFGAIAYMLLSGRHPFFASDKSCLSSEEDNIVDPKFRVAALEKLSDAPKKVCQAIMRLLDRDPDSTKAAARRRAAFEQMQQVWSSMPVPPRAARRGRSAPPATRARARRPKTPTPSRTAAVVALPNPSEEKAIAAAYAAARKQFFYYRDPDAALQVLEHFLRDFGWERFKESGSRSLADCWSLLAFIHNGRVAGTSYDKAEEAATHGLEVNSNHMESYQTRGWTRLQRRHPIGAIDDLEHALALATDATKRKQIEGQIQTARSLQKSIEAA